MSQTTEDQTTTAAPPTSEEVIGKVNESITALQSAQQTVVEGANLLGEHVNDPNAHGAAVPEVVMREMPQPIWNGTNLTFQKADGTQIVAPVNLKGEPGTPGRDGTDGTPGPVGPRPEHQWSGTELKIQNADGSWPETGINLKGEPGEVANLSDAVDSDSSSTAASSRAVKTVNAHVTLLEECVALGDISGTAVLDPSAGRVFAANVAGAVAIDAAADQPGASLLLVLTGGNGHVVTWDMSPRWSGGIAPVLSAKDLIALTCAPGGEWFGVLVSGDAK